jgi:hypothetical protein
MRLFIVRPAREGGEEAATYYVAAASIDQAFHLLSGQLPGFDPDRAEWEESDRYDLSTLHEPRVFASKRALRSL